MNLGRCGRCVCNGAVNNPASLRLIGLCPVLATTTSVLKALAMAAMLVAVMLIANVIASLCRASVVWRLKPVYFALIASLAVVIVVNAATAVLPALIDSLSIYPLLLAANCMVLAGIQEFSEHQPPAPSLRRALTEGSGVGLLMIVIATLRESAAHGLLFHDLALSYGMPMALHREYHGVLPIAGQAPGALLILALVLAAANAVRLRYPRTLAGSDGGS